MSKQLIFETERLVFRQFSPVDKDSFFDMMGNPKVMQPIPSPTLTRGESDLQLHEILTLYKIKSEKKIWAVDLKSNFEMIGLSGLIINNENENEIAYRLREKYWKHGYGTEIAAGLIKYGFKKLHFDLITGDAYIHNLKSIKILEKFMFFNKEFFNEKDNCLDRRYKLYKKDWLKA
ncbi:MAG: GNAT family N-acetyltransferase [Flavobacteriaceae bacterium]|nr:GNAT family N-acetyltransferase [Flavobacteriaceae bacterium]